MNLHGPQTYTFTEAYSVPRPLPLPAPAQLEQCNSQAVSSASERRSLPVTLSTRLLSLHRTICTVPELEWTVHEGSGPVSCPGDRIWHIAGARRTFPFKQNPLSLKACCISTFLLPSSAVDHSRACPSSFINPNTSVFLVG